MFLFLSAIGDIKSVAPLPGSLSVCIHVSEFVLSLFVATSKLNLVVFTCKNSLPPDVS